MVDAQTIGILVTAVSVTIAAVYYVMNLRVQQRNVKTTIETRRIGLLDSVINRASDAEGMRYLFELMRYEWSDYGDFERKYGSENNPEAAAKRYALCNTYNSIGMMIRKGLVDAVDLYDLGLTGPIYLYAKYRPVIEEGRRRYHGKDYQRDFEFLADEVLRVMKEKDPTFVFPETLDKYVPDK
ncbi:MAG: hypothetical protein ABSA11_15125 [Candidatus Bathyarchaeia archaeon]